MIILASRSASRRAMLKAAGVEAMAQPADVDERAIEASLAGAATGAIALALAEAKASAVSTDLSAAIVLGGDSMVEVEERRFAKPDTREQAAEHLRFFSGRAMRLYSAAAIARGGAVEWRHVDIATLTVRDLSDAFIAAYLDAEWPAVAGCVGAFRLEAMGVQLFERIDGDHFTVQGLPLLPVLGALRERGLLP